MLGATLTELWTPLCRSHAKEQRKERQEVRSKNWKRASGMEGAIPPNRVGKGGMKRRWNRENRFSSSLRPSAEQRFPFWRYALFTMQELSTSLPPASSLEPGLG